MPSWPFIQEAHPAAVGTHDELFTSAISLGATAIMSMLYLGSWRLGGSNRCGDWLNLAMKANQPEAAELIRKWNPDRVAEYMYVAFQEAALAESVDCMEWCHRHRITRLVCIERINNSCVGAVGYTHGDVEWALQVVTRDAFEEAWHAAESHGRLKTLSTLTRLGYPPRYV